MPSPQPVVVSGAKPETGHFEEFLANHAHFMLLAWRQCGELAEFDLGGMRNILMVGPDAHEEVFRVAEVKGDYDQVQLLVERPGEDLREKVEAAVRYCPNRVISIVEDD